MLVNNVDKKALAEVYAYLNFVGPRYLRKIPIEFLELIREKMDKNYYHKLQIIEMIANESLMKEAKTMIAYIECKYIISSESVLTTISKI